MNCWEELVSLRKDVERLRNDLRKKGEQETVLIEKCQQFLHVNPLSSLTPAEVRILRLIQTDPALHNKEIAEQVNITSRTVKFHLANMFVKFKVENRRGLIQKANSKV